MERVYIGGVGLTNFGPSDLGLLELLQEAGRKALESSDAQPEALFIGAMSPESLGHIANLATAAAHALGLSGIPAIRVETASSSGAAVFAVAASAVASGQYQRVLAIAGEKMTGLPTPDITKVLAEVIDPDERAVGLTMPAMAALIARAFAHAERLGEARLKEVLARIAIKAHANGSLNPIAQFRRPITLEAYQAGKPIADPLNIYDCAPISDGAAAVMLTSDETSVRLAGFGQGTDTPSLCAREMLTGFPATTKAARKAYRMAGFGPEAVDFAEVHDAFTIFELTSMRDLGLFEGRDAIEAIEEERTSLRGSLPINPSGGLKSRGHPVGASGLAQIVEATLQMRGEAGEERQLDRTSRALTHSIGGPGSNNFVVLLERSDSQALAVPSPGIPSIDSEAGKHKGKADDTRTDGRLRKSGRIESFTTLHAPAAGFPSPLTLALVGVVDGGRVLATAASTEGMRIGARAAVAHPEGGLPTVSLLPPRKLSLRWIKANASKARRLFVRKRPTTPVGP